MNRSTASLTSAQARTAICKKMKISSSFVQQKKFMATLCERLGMSPQIKLVNLTVIACCGLLSGCQATSVVQPWEKGNLAKPEMTFELDKQDTEFVEHTYSSKEGSSGGAGVGGGGCGCN